MQSSRRDREANRTQELVASNGQAIGIARLFTSLIGGGLLFILFYRITRPILTKASEQTTTEMGRNGNDWLMLLLENMPFVFAGIAFFGVIALAVFQSRLA